jgi:uncharacterized membrane protein
MVDSTQLEESPILKLMSYKVTVKRHLAKTVSYRLVSTAVGFVIMWWATGSIKLGAAFGLAELLYKPIQYYIHERVWYRWIKFGLVEEKKPKAKKVQINEEQSDVIIKEPEQIQQSTGKKVLSYSSNR